MIVIGSDHGGYKLKEEIKKYLDEKEIKYEDKGAYSEESVDYPEIAKLVASVPINSRELDVHFAMKSKPQNLLECTMMQIC